MTVTRLRFHGSGSGSQTGLMYIDLARELSKVNRKLHRQKKIYTVLGGYYIDSEGSRIDFNVAPHTWVTKRAINRGFAIWRKHISKTLENTEGMSSGKYSDFKLLLNNNHATSNMLATVDANDEPVTGGEWDYSTLISDNPDTGSGSPSTDTFDLQIVGPHSQGQNGYSRIGIMKSWVDSRPLPIAEDQPNNTIDSRRDPLSNLFDATDVQDARLLSVAEEGDQRPYDEDTFFGYYDDNKSGSQNNLQRVGTAFTVNTSLALAPVPGFQALCGLVQIRVDATSAWELVLDVESEGEAF